MESQLPVIVLENGLDLSKVITTGSTLHINQEYDDTDNNREETLDLVPVDFIGKPVPHFDELERKMGSIDEYGFVKKRIMVDGGGFPVHEGCTVFIAFSGYWENDAEAFDVRAVSDPMEVDLKDHGLLPGLEMAVKSMLVGETSVFLLSYKVMYGEIGIPPRIRPKSDCVFFIKLIKSILTPTEGKIQFSEPNMFQRIHRDVKKLYASGCSLYKSNNYIAAVQLFNKAVNMLHKCRLADESEEKVQESLLIKLYINLAVCYNKANKPYKTCIACNELNRLKSLWNNGKALFQNAKALRMIGEYSEAERRLKKAIKLCPESQEMQAEVALLQSTRESKHELNCITENISESANNLISDEFKEEVEGIIRNFKNNNKETQLVFPVGLNLEQMQYLRQVCIRENLFFNKMDKDKALGINGPDQSSAAQSTKSIVGDYILHKLDPTKSHNEVLALADVVDSLKVNNPHN